MGRVNLQSQNKVWGAAPGRETDTGKNKVEAPLRVHLDKRRYQSLCCLSCPGHVCPEAGPPSSYLTSSLFLSLDLPLGPSPIRWLLGSLAKDPGQGCLGEEEQEAPSQGPGWMVG